MFGFGLLTRLTESKEGLTAEVHGPHWTAPDSLALFRDGELIETVAVPLRQRSQSGLKFTKTWHLEINQKPSFYVAVATGPGISQPYWRMMPPYQADTPNYEPYLMGISPAIWVKPL